MEHQLKNTCYSWILGIKRGDDQLTVISFSWLSVIFSGIESVSEATGYGLSSLPISRYWPFDNLQRYAYISRLTNSSQVLNESLAVQMVFLSSTLSLMVSCACGLMASGSQQMPEGSLTLVFEMRVIPCRLVTGMRSTAVMILICFIFYRLLTVSRGL